MENLIAIIAVLAGFGLALGLTRMSLQALIDMLPPPQDTAAPGTADSV